MLTISNISEALAELNQKTGRVWTDSELFDLATRHGIELHAAPPITAQTTIQEFVIGEGLVEKFKMPPGHSALAVLFPAQVGQLWVSGETLTRQAYSLTQKEAECHWFTEPVRVTREQVRIKSQSLQKILGIWNRAQTGKEPRHRCPEWMFPTVAVTTPAPAQNAAKAAPVVQAKTKRRTWWDVASPYIVEVIRGGQYATAKNLHRALEVKAGEANSPFSKGTGEQRNSLFIRELAQPLSVKTLQNNWQKLQTAAARK